jgi:hypothetical protein
VEIRSIQHCLSQPFHVSGVITSSAGVMFHKFFVTEVYEVYACWSDIIPGLSETWQIVEATAISMVSVETEAVGKSANASKIVVVIAI